MWPVLVTPKKPRDEAHVPRYTYFIISPGWDLNSYVNYSDGNQGNYIKYGDATAPYQNGAGIRQAYLTHNPDIGVAAVMDSSAFAAPALGTRLKNYIINQRGIQPVGTSEWFSVVTAAAWGLFAAMQPWDGQILGPGDLATLQNIIAGHL